MGDQGPARSDARDAGGQRVQPEHHHIDDVEARALDLESTEVAEEEELEVTVPQAISLGSRLTDWRTALSFLIVIVLLGVALKAANIDFKGTVKSLKSANLVFFVLAFICYYASFPIRTHRWRRLMHNANHGALRQRIDTYPTWDLTQILYLSWFANVVVPAKLGDVYRAFLARRWLGVSLTRTVGTILAERILDLLVLFPLLIIAAFLTFKTQILSVPNIAVALGFGLVLALLGATVLAVIWKAGDSVLRVIPGRFHDTYIHFRHGVTTSFGDDAPLLAGETVVIWLLEGTRLTCILAALGLFGTGQIGISTAIFLALGSSVLTTLPLTPGGLGFVELFIAGVLTFLLHQHTGGRVITNSKEIGLSVALLDRVISYLSIVVIGLVVYLFSGKASGAGPAQPASDTAAGGSGDGTPSGTGRVAKTTAGAAARAR